MKKYNIIYADPPWHFNQVVGIFQDGGRPQRFTHDIYPTMKKEELLKLPIKELADKDCALFMWTTDGHLPEALELIKAWRFKYKSIAFVWVKKSNKGNTFANVGPWTMKNCEICLIATKGNMVKYKIKRNIFQLVEAERTQHSKKPQEVRDRIINLFGNIPKIELFAREKIEDWDVWGNEVESDIELLK